MYRIPENISENFLEGAIVEMICFNISQIYIYFDNKVQIIIEGRYSLNVAGYENTFDVYPVTSDNRLLQLINKRVMIVEIDNERKNLLIKFEEENTLAIVNNDSYESCIIKIGDRVIIL
jgi:hypothetical protein